MPYRNVYEEGNKRRSLGSDKEPEKNPRKIAQIYRSQMPTDADTKETERKLSEIEVRKKKAMTLNRGIKKTK